MKRLIFCLGILVSPVFSTAGALGQALPDNPAFIGFVCAASGGSAIFGGRLFYGYGTNLWQAERDALRQCERASYLRGRCEVLGCRRQLPEPFDGRESEAWEEGADPEAMPGGIGPYRYEDLRVHATKNLF